MKMRRSAFQKRGRTQEVRAALPSGRATLVTDGKRQVTIHIYIHTATALTRVAQLRCAFAAILS